MTRIQVAVEIDASPAAVWAVVEPIERHTEWMVDATAIHFQSPQHRGVGTRFICDTKVGPITLADMMTVTEWEPGRRMGVRHDGIVTGLGAFEIEPLDFDRRARFTWTEDLRFPWYLGGSLGERFGGRVVMRRIWRRNLTRLREIVEAG